MGCPWGVTQLFGYKNVLLKYWYIYPGDLIWVELKNRFESVSNQQLCY